MFPQNPSERHGALAVPDLLRILLNHKNLVRLWLMAPNTKLSLKIDGAIKVFHDKQKL
jgi:hypothetical protein